MIEPQSAPRTEDVPRRSGTRVDRSNEQGVVARGDDQGRPLLGPLFRCRRIGGVEGYVDDHDRADEDVLGIESFAFGRREEHRSTALTRVVVDRARPGIGACAFGAGLDLLGTGRAL